MNFDPMSEVPKTDEQAKEAIFFGKNEIVAKCGWGLYQIFRERDGMTVLQAYKEALLKMIEFVL